ncbi:major facilitator superfamily domain-containing protein, partial [Lipomyces orientalis]
NVLLPTLVVELRMPEASSIWPSTAFSLAVTSTLLIFGRLADMFGACILYVAGIAWVAVSSIVLSFSKSWLMLVIFRALQGLALGALLPSGVMLLGSIYRPGPRKNIVFSIYGACAALGFYIGIFFSGLCGQLLGWRWYFYIGTILAGITLVSSYFSIPNDYAEKRKFGPQMDWLGAACLVSGLVLISFAIVDSSQAPHQWRTPYISVCFVLGVVILGVAVYVEGWVAEAPLLPPSLFAVPYMKPLILSMFFLYGCLGIFLLYGALYMENIMGADPLQVVAWTSPMAAGGIIISVVGGLVLHMVSGTLLMITSCLGFMGSGILFALIPIGGNYWTFVFPAMICATIGIDISFNITNIFITTNVSTKQQGVAGALINCTLHLGITLMLGFADIIQTNTSNRGLSSSYKVVFWFQFGLSTFALMIIIIFVKIHRAKSDLTVDERRQQGLGE